MLPSALDVPHWARFSIQAAREKFGGLALLSDNEIYATLRNGGFNVARSEQRLDLENHCRELAAWRTRDQQIQEEQSNADTPIEV